MKKILLILLFAPLFSSSQSLDTVSVSLTLRSQDWAWAIGEYGEGSDSASRVKVRQIRQAIITANPQTWGATVQINNLPGKVVFSIYRLFCAAPFSVVFSMGNTTAERATIFTNIRAINNAALQFFISLQDSQHLSEFERARNKGKNIILDN